MCPSLRDSLTLEVLPALRLELSGDTPRVAQEDLRRTGDAADLGQSNPGNFGWNPLARRGGEKQFVVFAAVEREVEIDFAGRLSHAGPGNQGGGAGGSPARFFTEMRPF